MRRIGPGRRTRPAVALVLLTAWLGTVGVAGPLQRPAEAAIGDTVLLSSPAASPGNERVATFDFTVPAGASAYTCTLGLDSAQPQPVTCAEPSYTTPSLQTDGTWTFTVTATYPDVDVPSSDSPTVLITTPVPPTSDSAQYVLDTQAAFNLTPPAASPSSATQPHWGLTGEALADLSCTLVDPDGNNVVGGACDPATGYTAPALTTNGNYTLTVVGTDGLGNDDPRTGTYDLDTVAEITVVTTDVNSQTPTWTYDAEPYRAGSVSCTLAGPTGTVDVTCGSTSYTAPSLADGNYMLTVTATDLVGNAGTGSSLAYSLDATVQTSLVPGFTTTASGSNNATPAWTFTGDPVVDAVCTLVRDADQKPIGGGTCDPLTGYQAPTLTQDGAYSLSVLVTDEAGNTTTLTDEYLLDTQVDLAVTAPTPNPGNNRRPTWGIDVEAYRTIACELTGPVGPVTGGTCDASGYIPPTLTADGAYSLAVTVTDVAGNTDSVIAVDYVLDTPPAAPVLSTPSNPNRLSPLPFSFTTPGGGATSCTIIGPIPADSTVSALETDFGCPTAGSYEAPLTGEGDYRLEVTATDGGGSTTATFAYHFDATPASATLVAPTGPSRLATVDIGYSSPSEPVTATCTATSPQGGSVLISSCQPTQTITLPSDGTWTFTVTLRDAAQNMTTYTSSPYVFDATAPAAPGISPMTSTSNVQRPVFTITITPADPVSCQLLGPTKLALTVLVDCSSGSYTPDLTALADNTTYYVRAVANDTVGSGPEKLATYNYDRTKPATPRVTGPTGPANDQTPTWSWTNNPAETTPPTLLCTLTLEGNVVGTASGPCPAGLEYSLPALTADGSYVLTLELRDAAGNVSLPGSSEPYILDTTPPTAPAFTSGPPPVDNLTDVSWAFTTNGAAKVECQLMRVGTATPLQPFADCTNPHRVAALPGEGQYYLQVRLTDAYGNATAPVSSATYTVDLTPPGKPTVSGPSGTGSTTAVSYSIVGPIEPGATAECQLRLNGTKTEEWAPSCTLPRPVNLVGEGTWTMAVRLTDQYGNLGVEGVNSPGYLLDTLLPATPKVTPQANPASDVTPSFTFVIDADTTATCQLTRGSTTADPAATCTSPYTSPALTADGDYVLTVVSKDAAGNTSSGSSAPYTLDTDPPKAPSVTGPAGPSQTRNPAFTWAGEAGATAECSTKVDDAPASGWTACSSPYSPTLPGDGTWTLSVRLSDAAKNVGLAGVSGGYVLDTTAPATPQVTAPSSPGRILAPSWSAVTEAGSTTECRFTGQLDFTPCTLPLSTPVTSDGEYVLSVRATDVAGNVSPVGTGTYVLDTTAPPAPVVTSPTGPGRSRTPSIAFTTEAGSTGSCRLTRGATVVSDTGPCTSPAALDLTGLPDGAYTLTVRAVDAAGNTGPAATGTYVLDTTAPAAPVFTVVPGSPSSDTAPVYAFNTEAGSTPVCRLTAPSGSVKDLTCTSPLTLALSGAADGDYVLTITTKDPAGNTSPAATSTFQLDSKAPAAPRVTGPVTPGNTRTPTWRISSADPAECRLVRGITVVEDWAACGTSRTADLYNQPDGAYQLEARVIGTTAATVSRYRLDTAPPTPAVLTAPPSPSTLRRPVWAVASPEASVTAECRLMLGISVLKDWAPCAVSTAGSLFSGADLTGLGDGTYTLHVRLTDLAGNAGPEATSDYVLDTSAPAAVGVVPPPSPGSDPTPTWTLVAPTGTKLECKLTAGATVVKAFAPCTDTYSADLTGLADGTYTMTVHALSAAGSPGPDTSNGYVFDTQGAAAPTALTVDPVGPSQNRAPRWTFVLPAGTTAVCKVTLGQQTISSGPCSSPYVMDLSNAADGSYTLTVRAVDAAGNLSDAATKGYVLRTVPPSPPTFTAVPGSPSSTIDPQWSFTTGRGATAQCRILYANSVSEDWFGCSSPYPLYLSGRPDGHYSLQVRSVDTALNTSKVVSSDYDFDRTAGAGAVFLDTPATPGNDLSPTWIVSTTSGSTAAALLRSAALTSSAPMECRYTSPAGTGAWSPCSGTYTGTTAGDFRYRLDVRMAATGTSAAGPTSSSWYQLDTGKPASPVLTAGQPAVGREAAVSWSWSEDPDTATECRLLKGGIASGPFADCTSPFTADLTRSGQGSYAAEVRAVDLAGNVGDPGVGSYRYDTTPPAAPVFTSRPPTRGTATSVAWMFGLPEDGTTQCRLTHNGVVTQSTCNGEFRLDRLTQPGTWTLSVQYVDSAGNVGQPTVGSYTLTAPGIVRGPGSGSNGSGGGGNGSGGGAFIPRPPSGGFGNGNVPDAPTGASPGSILARPQHPKLDAIARAADPLKRAASSVVKALPIPRVPGFSEGKRVPDAIKNVLNSTITKPQLPLALFVIVVLFLLVQNRIDRRDPKLAAAPVAAEPELAFGPRVRSSMQTGGATA